MEKYIPNYTENMDVIEIRNLENYYNKAIINSNNKNKQYETTSLVDRNPYTEVQSLVELLINLK